MATFLALAPSHSARAFTIMPFIPSLSQTSRKGQHGRVAVVGGSEEYTGAPYYAGVSALKTGADLAYIVCARSAATAIKSYSPELIVHPVFESGNGSSLARSSRDLGAEAEAARSVLARADSIVFGPGLGRDPDTLKVVAELIQWAGARGTPCVIDGDALWLVAQVRAHGHVI